MGNREGRALALTVLSPIKPWGPFFLRIFFWANRVLPSALAPLRRLSFIHYARWNILTGIPYNGPPQKREKLHYSYLMFTSNFNGRWDEYIDTFSYTIPWPMRFIWGSSYGFPGPIPVQLFKDYIHKNEFIANHYYSAYPRYPTTVIIAALDLKQKFEAFRRRVEGMNPEQFKQEYEEFLTAVQRSL